MKRTVLVNGVEIQVDPDDPQASVIEVEPGVYSVILLGDSFEARVSPGTVEIGGEVFATEVVDPRARRVSKARRDVEGRQTLIAPMPGKVVRLLASEGQTVSAEQGILVIEAMKMQNEIQSPRSGTVVSLPVPEGNAVAAGDIVAVVE